MKTKMIGMTLVAVLGIAGATSALAQNYDNSYEWIQQAASSKSQTVNTDRIGNASPQSSGESIPCPSNCH